MVLRNHSFIDMTHEERMAAGGTKVHQTWNLHQACLQHDLDLLVLFGAICATVDMQVRQTMQPPTASWEREPMLDQDYIARTT